MDYHQVYNGSWLIDGSYTLNTKCLPMVCD
uniref:Uncharacterized protein n=1 Tax=Tetranychus urticae TaxID=32264 RepID=T1KJM2_TETUR